MTWNIPCIKRGKGSKDYVTTGCEAPDGTISKLQFVEILSEYAIRHLVQYFEVCDVDEKLDDGTKVTWEDVLLIPVRYWRERKIYTYGRWDGKKYKSVSLCGFNSMADYLIATGQGKLDFTDQEFYERHPLTVSEGLPFKATPQVIQELIDPYGLRITGFRLAPGWQLEDSLLDLANALGVNPLARENLHTSNEEFAKLTGAPLEEIIKQFAFEFRTDPFRPGIVCTNDHASYFAPRHKAVADMGMSYIVGRAPWPYPDKALNYNTAIPEPEPEPMEADFYQIMETYQKLHDVKPKGIVPNYNGTTEWDRETNRWVSKEEKARLEAERARFRSNQSKKAITCRLCDTETAAVGNPATWCSRCWRFLWDTYRCSTCKMDFKNIEALPKYRGINRQYEELIAVCPSCHKDFALTPDKDEFIKMFITAYLGSPSRFLKEKWNRLLPLGLSARTGSLRGYNQDNNRDAPIIPDPADADPAANLASGGN